MTSNDAHHLNAMMRELMDLSGNIGALIAGDDSHRAEVVREQLAALRAEIAHVAGLMMVRHLKARARHNAEDRL